MTPISLGMDLLGLLSILAWISHLELFSYEKEASELPYLHNHHLTLPTLSKSSALTLKHSGILVLEASGMDVMQYSMPFPNFWRNELYHSATFLTD